VQARQHANGAGVRRLNKQPSQAEVAHRRDVLPALALPANPYIASSLDTSTPSPGRGISGPQGGDSDRSGHLVHSLAETYRSDMTVVSQ
jgi:hypothetical protein